MTAETFSEAYERTGRITSGFTDTSSSKTLVLNYRTVPNVVIIQHVCLVSGARLVSASDALAEEPCWRRGSYLASETWVDGPLRGTFPNY